MEQSLGGFTICALKAWTKGRSEGSYRFELNFAFDLAKYWQPSAIYYDYETHKTLQ